MHIYTQTNNLYVPPIKINRSIHNWLTLGKILQRLEWDRFAHKSIHSGGDSFLCVSAVCMGAQPYDVLEDARCHDL